MFQEVVHHPDFQLAFLFSGSASGIILLMFGVLCIAEEWKKRGAKRFLSGMFFRETPSPSIEWGVVLSVGVILLLSIYTLLSAHVSLYGFLGVVATGTIIGLVFAPFAVVRYRAIGLASIPGGVCLSTLMMAVVIAMASD